MQIDLIGYVAAILTTIAFVPQALTSWRTRDLSGVSLPMYSIFTAGVAVWLAYGVMLGSWAFETYGCAMDKVAGDFCKFSYLLTIDQMVRNIAFQLS